MRNYEGSYMVIAQMRSGTFNLETPDETPIPRTWHSNNLRQPYQWYSSFVQA